MSDSPIGYSYIRFSSAPQERGDSLRRQAEAASAWFKKNSVTMDTGTTLHDLGRSAFRGKHRTDDKAALAGFLKLVESGRVPRGSYLVVEALDRITREDVLTATHLVTGILLKGIRIVQLSPSEIIYTEKSQPHEIMLMIVELMRGHGESKVKSDRLSAVWATKKKAAREGRDQPPRKATGKVTKAMTSQLPAWVEDRDGQLVLIPERAALVRRLFRMTLEGKGQWQIVKTLTAEGIKTWGRGGHWSKPYVRKILKSRAVLGEFQPRRHRQPEGPPILDYFPRVVDLTTWERARDVLAGRRSPSGRIGKKVTNLFTGLLHDVTTGGPLYISWQNTGTGTKRRKVRLLAPAAAMDGSAPMVSFPYSLFECSLLDQLRLVVPAEVFGADAKESGALALELAGVEARLAQIEVELEDGDGKVTTLARVAKNLESKRDDLSRRLSEARAKEANPPAVAFVECRNLLDTADDPEARMRIRTLLRLSVESIWVMVMAEGRNKRCHVDVRFRGGRRREFLIDYRPAFLYTQGKYRVARLPEVPRLEDQAGLTDADWEGMAGEAGPWLPTP
jgi:DNA invertase Pin-like site-specific DNA recombinase